MKKYICTVRAIITETYELEEEFEISAPDEVQAGDDAVTAAENSSLYTWLQHPNAHPNIRNVVDIETDFILEDTEEKKFVYGEPLVKR